MTSVYYDHNAFQGFPMPLTLQPHQWVKERRLDLGLRQEDVETRSAQMGSKHVISQSHLSRIERGTKSLSSLGPDRMDALRRILDVSHEEWVERTGLEIVTKERLEQAGRNFSPAPIVEIPPNLKEALEFLAKEDPAYADPILAEKLAMADPEDGNTDPPVSDWMNLAMAVMKIRRRR